MLTAKENMLALVKGGKPDRLVNQYEAMHILMHPYAIKSNSACSKGEMNKVDVWGVTRSFPENVPGAFPVHTNETIVCKDIENWKDYVHAPKMEYSQGDWDLFKEMYNQVDGTKAFKTAFFAPGLFEMSHYLCGMAEALEYYLTNTDEMEELIKYLTEFELELVEQICSNLHPDAVLHHDDWGSAINSFLRPSMFEDLFVEPYKQIYGYMHDHGVQVIVHHSDSYAANLVPAMIEMGIDVWQGAVESNDVPALIKQYGDKLTFMGAIDNKSVDFNGWNKENCIKEVRRTIDACGTEHFIPCITQGGPGSVYPGVYMELADEIDRFNAEHFDLDLQGIKGARLPHQIMF